MNTSGVAVPKTYPFGGIKFNQVDSPSDKIFISDSISESILESNSRFGYYLGGKYEGLRNGIDKSPIATRIRQRLIYYFDGHIETNDYLQITVEGNSNNFVDKWKLPATLTSNPTALSTQLID